MTIKKILITGTSWFIWYHTAKKMLAKWYQITWIDVCNDYYDVNLKKKRTENLLAHKNYTHFNRDLADDIISEKLKTIVSPDIIIHLAAQAWVRYSLTNPDSYIKSNILWFYNMINFAKDHKVDKFLYASSSSVYWNHQDEVSHISSETSKPVSLYAATKKSNELLAHTYSHIYWLPTYGMRFFTVYGPRWRPDMAYYSFAEKILNNEEISVYNNWNMRRDFTYIDDIVSCIDKIANYKNNETLYNIVNIGKGKPDKLSDFIHILEKKLNKKANIVYKEMPSVDVERTSADITQTMQKYDWKPTVGIEEWLKNFTEWFLSYKNNNIWKK